MKLMLVIGGLARGGTERQVALLANGLAERGHEISLVLLTTRSQDDYALAENVSVVALNIKHWRRVVGAVYELRQHMDAADVVYSFLDLANALCALAHLTTATPLIWGWRASNVATTRLSRLALQVCRLLRSQPAAAVANANAVADFYRGQLNLLPVQLPVVVVPNAIAPEYSMTRDRAALRTAWRATHSIPPAAFVVLCLSRAAAEKRQDVLLAALQDQAGVFIVLAGDGVPPKLQQWLPIGLDPAVRQAFLARILALDHSSDVHSMYAGADALVQISDHEGSPNTLLEAMASGLPVVATAVGGTIELLQDNQLKRGWLVPPSDVEALANAILAVQNKASVVGEYTKRAKDYVTQHHGLDKLLESTEQLMDRVAGSGSTLS